MVYMALPSNDTKEVCVCVSDLKYAAHANTDTHIHTIGLDVNIYALYSPNQYSEYILRRTYTI